MNQVYVYIGRFQLPHVGHESVITHALGNSDHLVLLVGSSEGGRTTKNPFSFEERKEMLAQITDGFKNNKKVSVLSLPDFATDEEWTNEVQKLVTSVTETDDKIFITGCRKTGDESTYYLQLFPDWHSDFISEVSFPGIDVISSTKARALFYKNEELPDFVSPSVKGCLQMFKEKELFIFESLVESLNAKRLKI